MLQKRRTNHFGHLLLTILFFPWAIAWIAFHLSNQRHNDQVDMVMFQMMNKNG